jgi:hypothetical protein
MSGRVLISVMPSQSNGTEDASLIQCARFAISPWT